MTTTHIEPVAWRGLLGHPASLTASLLLGLLVVSGCDRGAKPEQTAVEARTPDEPKVDKHDNEAKLTAAAVAENGITVGTVTRRPLVPTAVVPARVSYDLERMAHIAPPVGGRVIELRVRLGDTVSKDDLVAVLDSPELGEAQSEYLQRRTTLATAKPAVDLAAAAVSRAEQLIRQSQGISISEVQRRQGELQAARGSAQAAEAGIVAAESKLRLLGMTADAVEALAKDGRINSRYEVRSPIAGQVVEREVTVGEFVRPDRDPLMLVVDLSTLWVIADVPQSRLPSLAVGDPAHVLLPADGQNRSTIEGKVAYISPRVDPNTRTAQVRVEVGSRSTPLRAGMFVQAEISLPRSAGGTAEPVLAVPEAAVQSVGNATVVFVPVPGEANTFAKRPVQVGPTVGGWVPVPEGLHEGQDVVVSGSFVLKAELGKSAVEED